MILGALAPFAFSAAKTVGDVNGDGLGDLLIAPPSGRSYVVYGDDSPTEPLISIEGTEGDDVIALRLNADTPELLIDRRTPASVCLLW